MNSAAVFNQIPVNDGAKDALVHAYNNLGVSLWGLGDPAGIDYIRTSLAMAIEHNIPDEAGRAYVNHSGQGAALQPLPYAEAEALLDEAGRWFESSAAHHRTASCSN